MEFKNLADQIITKTKVAGATDCDIVLAKGTSKSIAYRFGKIEDVDAYFKYLKNQICSNFLRRFWLWYFIFIPIIKY